MPALPEAALLARLRGALPEDTRTIDDHHVRPAEFSVPKVGKVRVYLWTLTRDASSAGRPPDEFKIQLILPALMQGRGARGSLDLEDVEVTLLLGFSPELGVFCAWEASRYTDFAYSANAQVKEALLLEAQESGWAVAEPRPKKGQEPEVRVAFTPGNLPHFIKVAKEADDKGLVADDRMNWFLRQAPDLAGEPRLPRGAPPEPSEQIRAKRLTLRLERDRKFAVTVRKEYGSACVVCGLQLEIVEGAHIIPAGETGGVDEGWNGLCLCPTHHRLFDALAFVIDPYSLKVLVVKDRVTFLQESGLGGGVEILTDFEGQAITKPASWKKDSFRADMQRALAHRVRAAGR